MLYLPPWLIISIRSLIRLLKLSYLRLSIQLFQSMIKLKSICYQHLQNLTILSISEISGVYSKVSAQQTQKI
jgi:hypothetical protein